MAGSSIDLVRRFIDEVFVAGRADAVDELVTPDFVSHPLSGAGPEVMKAAIGRVAGALTDVSFEIQDTIAEGDRVAVRLVSSAVHAGTFMGIPSTGRRYALEEIHIFRLADGRVAEHWHQMDSLGMLQQLGVSPGGGG
jgi:steroid delta-isomerase-like uncharacterized protein